MQDPEKEKFILESIEKIKALKQEIIEGKKNHTQTKDLMEHVQREIEALQKQADIVFDSKNFNMSPEELNQYLQNPSNFSREDWDLLESIRKETADCKKEILKSQEGENAKDFLKKRKGKLKKKKRPPPTKA